MRENERERENEGEGERTRERECVCVCVVNLVCAPFGPERLVKVKRNDHLWDTSCHGS